MPATHLVELRLIFLDSGGGEISSTVIGSAPSSPIAYVPVSGSGAVPPLTRTVRVRVGSPPVGTAGGGADLISVSFVV